MEGVVHRDDLVAPGRVADLAGEFNHALVGLRTGICKEDYAVEAVGDQLFSEARHHIVHIEVGDVDQRRGLLLNGGGYPRIAVPEVADGNPGGEIEIFAAVGVPQARALASDKQNLRGIGGHHILAVPFDGGFVKVFHLSRLLNSETFPFLKWKMII